MKRWALVGGLVAGTALAAILGVVALFANTGCAVLTLERMDAARGPTPEREPVALDEARVRNDAPTLAALLDRAVDEGRAVEDHEQTARAMDRYLQEATGGHRGPVAWRGEAVRVLMALC